MLPFHTDRPSSWYRGVDAGCTYQMNDVEAEQNTATTEFASPFFFALEQLLSPDSDDLVINI